jgi:hypothetical protein
MPRIKSVVKNEEVYVRLSDIMLSLREDLDNVKSDEVKEYIRDDIKVWKKYEKDILEQAGIKF